MKPVPVPVVVLISVRRGHQDFIRVPYVASDSKFAFFSTPDRTMTLISPGGRIRLQVKVSIMVKSLNVLNRTSLASS